MSRSPAEDWQRLLYEGLEALGPIGVALALLAWISPAGLRHALSDIAGLPSQECAPRSSPCQDPRALNSKFLAGGGS